MSIELVTGHAGSAHVSGADVGALLASLVDKGSWVLGEAPAVTMTDANTLSIGPCEILMQGRHVRLVGYTNVTLRSGAQTGKRADLVVIRYSMSTDGTGVETADLVVVEGVTGETAADPAIPNTSSVLEGATVADVAVARVTFDALTPSAEWLLPSMSQFVGHKHSAADMTSGTLPVARGGTGATSASAARSGLGIGNLPVYYYGSKPNESAMPEPCLVVLSDGSTYLYN